MMASKRNGTLYTGVTSALVQRIWQHRTGASSGFSRKYDCKMLVWYELHDDMQQAHAREANQGRLSSQET
jgi:putative endonuclease